MCKNKEIGVPTDILKMGLKPQEIGVFVWLLSKKEENPKKEPTTYRARKELKIDRRTYNNIRSRLFKKLNKEGFYE